MKKRILSVLIVFALVIASMLTSVTANVVSANGAQIGEYGSFISGNQVIDQMIKKWGTNTHPRIIMTNDKLAELKKHIGDGSETAKLLEDLRNQADNHLTESVGSYDTSGEDSFLEVSKRMQRFVVELAMAYNIFGDEKYAKRAYEIMQQACEFTDWNPYHFLDTAEMCTGLAFGYDLLYKWMNDAQRKLIRTSLIDKGLNQVMNDYTDNLASGSRSYYWYRATKGENWQFVCTGGPNLAALAIGDEKDAKDIAAKVLDYGYKRAYSSVRLAYSNVDGTYTEGLGYWDYATYYLGFQSSALVSATGTDYGLADYEGLRKSVDFIRYMSSNTPTSFSFGDDGAERNTGWPVFLWLGKYYNSPALSSIRIKNRKKDKDGFRYQDVLWMDESKQTGLDDIYNETDWGAVGSSNASFRNTWDISGIVAALHTGENDYIHHGHYDLGSFYIESNGARFFTDLGNENDYKLYNRQFSYRIKAEGHNTLVINPTDGIDQKEGVNCLITEFNSGNEAYAITDLTEAYKPSGANSVNRGLKMIKDKECVIVQDEISLNKPGEIYWFAHTKGSIDIGADGKSAIVTVDSDRLWVGIMSEDGTFTKMDAEPLETSLDVPGASDNSGYKKLVIHLINTKDTTISVACIPLKNGAKRPSWTPTKKALSEWSSGEEKHDFSKKIVSDAYLASAATATSPAKYYYACAVCGEKGTKTYTIENTQLTTPKLSTPSVNENSIAVKWGKVTNAVLYRVFRKNDAGTWTKIKDVKTNSFEDVNVESGKSYTYTVRCVSADGKTYTSAYDKTGVTATYCSMPVLKSVAPSEEGVKVAWNKVTGAACYRVYRKTASGSWEKVGDTTSTSIVDKKTVSGNTYSYTVKCIDSSKTVATSAYDKNGIRVTYCSVPVLKSTSTLDGSVKVTWNAVTGASSYRVYRKTSGGRWKAIGNTKKVTFTDTTVESGTKYIYTVRCLDTDGATCISGYDTTGITVKYCAMPNVTAVSNTTKGVKVTWGAVTGSPKYRVYRKVFGGNWTKVADTASTSYVDTIAVKGTKYTYTVRCLDADGKTLISAYDAIGKTITFK